VNYVKEAPVTLIYMCDYAKMVDRTSDEAKHLFSCFHAGVIAHTIYCYCASEGLATVVREYIDIAAVAKALKIQPHQKTTSAQPVGYPRKTS
jgi:nitroreductase